MPRITEERREARRAEIVAAARRCFSRDGFHQTSMPDIAREAGVSVGAPYRYFAGKEELIVELAGDAFHALFAPIVAAGDRAGTLPDLVAASIDGVSGAGPADRAGQPVPVDELLRCAVQAWSELLVHDGVGTQARAGFDDVRSRLTDVLRRGQIAGTVPVGLDPEQGSRIVMALLHGFVLQRVAFGLDDAAVAAFVRDVRVVLGG